MRTRFHSLLLSAAAAIAFAAPASATELNITCRCVVGGVNSGMAEWIEQKVIPAFTEKMKAEGKDVTVKLTQFGGEDEQLTQQLALDFSTGAGPDVSASTAFSSRASFRATFSNHSRKWPVPTLRNGTAGSTFPTAPKL